MTESVTTKGAGKCETSCADVHQFCFSNCCVLRCVIAVAIVGIVFAAGYCAGAHGGERHHRFESHHGYGEYGEREWGAMPMYRTRGDSAGNVMFYRTSAAAQELPAQTNSAAETMQAVP